MTEACVLCMWCDQTLHRVDLQFYQRFVSGYSSSCKIVIKKWSTLQRDKRNCVFWVWLCHLLWSSAPWIEGFHKHEVSFRFVVYNALPRRTERKKADCHVCKICIKTNSIPQESFDCSTAFIHWFFFDTRQVGASLYSIINKQYHTKMHLNGFNLTCQIKDSIQAELPSTRLINKSQESNASNA